MFVFRHKDKKNKLSCAVFTKISRFHGQFQFSFGPLTQQESTTAPHMHRIHQRRINSHHMELLISLDVAAVFKCQNIPPVAPPETPPPSVLFWDGLKKKRV